VHRVSAKPSALLAIAVLTAIAAAGCGGSDEVTSSNFPFSPPSLSKAEFIEQANAACERERAIMMKKKLDFERLKAERPPEPGSSDVAHFVYLPAMEAQVWRMEELGVPRGEAKRIDELLSAARFAIDAAAVIRKLPSIAAAEQYFDESDKLYRAYGLDSCANNGSGSAGKGV
jgi:hypothetical protein